MYLQETGCKILHWINLAQCKIQWRAIVNKVMNFCNQSFYLISIQCEIAINCN
jgi:hypothetical protein